MGKQQEIEIIQSCGNPWKDFGFPDAERRLENAKLDLKQEMMTKDEYKQMECVDKLWKVIAKCLEKTGETDPNALFAYIPIPHPLDSVLDVAMNHRAWKSMMKRDPHQACVLLDENILDLDRPIKRKQYRSPREVDGGQVKLDEAEEEFGRVDSHTHSLTDSEKHLLRKALLNLEPETHEAQESIRKKLGLIRDAYSIRSDILSESEKDTPIMDALWKEYEEAVLRESK